MAQSVLEGSERTAIEVEHLHKTYGGRDSIQAVRDVSFSVGRGEVMGLLGPDGAGKTSILQMIAGVATPDDGSIRVQDTDVSVDPETVKRNVGYMPQGLGRNLYERLSVRENIEFFRDLRDLPAQRMQENIDQLLQVTRLSEFMEREARNLSGGMRQKLALVCTLLHVPDVLLLDEPTTGVDPISRQQFWKVMHDLIRTRNVTILLTTSYMGEAERCHNVLFMHEGKVIESGTPDELRNELSASYIYVETDEQTAALSLLENDPDTVHARETGGRITVITETSPEEVRSLLEDNDIPIDLFRPFSPGLEDVFIHRLEQQKSITDLGQSDEPEERDDGDLPEQTVIDTNCVTRTFGDFTAVDQVSLELRRGDVFGLLGPNGAGKTTLMKMMVGLLEPSEGSLQVLGEDMHYQKKSVQRRIGYMAQNFSLYEDLTIRENLDLFGGLYDVPTGDVERIVERLRLGAFTDQLAGDPPVGIRQRVGLACSLLHRPPVLFLDEPTAGVDPLTRRTFWNLIYDLSRNRNTTVLITTHFMAEADMCDRLALMNHGRLVACDTPAELKRQARQKNGEVLAVRCDDFRQAFALLESEYPSAALYGDRIHIRTRQPEQDREQIEKRLTAEQITVNDIIQSELSMQETFVDFLKSDDA